MGKAFFVTARELAGMKPGAWPEELDTRKHLVFSSPAALAFNSPGAQGFGVKKAALSLPGSVMLLVAPACCGRNTASLGGLGCERAERTYYLLLDDTDIVTGRYLKRVPEAVQAVCRSLAEPPSAVMICTTCVDALLGTDEERLCRESSALAGVPVISCTMYALTREGRTPPMTLVRRSLYSLLKPREREKKSMNVLGFFTPLQDSCELYRLCAAAGIAPVRELSRCRDMEEYGAMAGAAFSLVLNPEAELAASTMAKKLGIPWIELALTYQPEKIRRQYQLFGQTIGCSMDSQQDYDAAVSALDSLYAGFGAVNFSLGEVAAATPYDLALALLQKGFGVREIFSVPGAAQTRQIARLAEMSPETRIYSNLSPSMLFYRPEGSGVDFAVGRDACWYHQECPGMEWCPTEQPFGYAGVASFCREAEQALSGGSRS